MKLASVTWLPTALDADQRESLAGQPEVRAAREVLARCQSNAPSDLDVRLERGMLRWTLQNVLNLIDRQEDRG